MPLIGLIGALCFLLCAPFSLVMACSPPARPRLLLRCPTACRHASMVGTLVQGVQRPPLA
eukprot:9421375-Prorocentrum_lima.AAC.1